jgi:hypothetical protein
MTTTKPTSPTASAPPTRGDLLADVVPLIDTVFVAGPPVLVAWVAALLLTLMLVGPFALLVTFVVVFVAAAALVTLAGAILAVPYLLVRHLRAGYVALAMKGTTRRLTSAKTQRAVA